MNIFMKNETFHEAYKRLGDKAISVGKPSIRQLSKILFCTEPQDLKNQADTQFINIKIKKQG